MVEILKSQIVSEQPIGTATQIIKPQILPEYQDHDIPILQAKQNTNTLYRDPTGITDYLTQHPELALPDKLPTNPLELPGFLKSIDSALKHPVLKLMIIANPDWVREQISNYGAGYEPLIMAWLSGAHPEIYTALQQGINPASQANEGDTQANRQETNQNGLNDEFEGINDEMYEDGISWAYEQYKKNNKQIGKIAFGLKEMWGVEMHPIVLGKILKKKFLLESFDEPEPIESESKPVIEPELEDEAPDLQHQQRKEAGIRHIRAMEEELRSFRAQQAVNEKLQSEIQRKQEIQDEVNKALEIYNIKKSINQIQQPVINPNVQTDKPQQVGVIRKIGKWLY